MENFLTSAFKNIEAGRDLVRGDKKRKILSEVDIMSPESIEAGIGKMMQAGDIEGQKQLSDVLSNYHRSALEKKKIQREMDQPNIPKPEIAMQQSQIIGWMKDLIPNVDEKVYPVFVQQADMFGYGKYLPKDYAQFDASRQDLMQQADMEQKALMAIGSQASGPIDQVANRIAYDAIKKFGGDVGEYSPTTNYSKTPAPIIAGLSRLDLQEGKDIRQELRSIEQSAKQAAEVLGVVDSLANINLNVLFSKAKKKRPDVDITELSASVVRRIKNKYGEYPTEAQVSNEINSMIQFMDSAQRVNQDKASPRLEAAKKAIQEAKK